MRLQRYEAAFFMEPFNDWERSLWPENGSIITRSRIVTEKFKVEYLDEDEARWQGGYKLTPITEEKNDD